MKLLTLACPNCGAKLQLNEELKQASCNFCGYTFLIDDEVRRVSLEIQNPQQLGRDLEIGRRSVRGGNVELAWDVYTLIEPLSSLHENAVEADRLQKDIDAKKKNIKIFQIVSIAIASVFLLLSILVAVRNSSASSFFSGLFFTVLFASVPLILWGLTAYRLKDTEKKYNKIQEKIAELQEKLKPLPVDIIPPPFRYRQALTFFYDALYNQRAMTMQECINLYDQWIHNNKMEAIQKAQLDQLNTLTVVTAIKR